MTFVCPFPFPGQWLGECDWIPLFLFLVGAVGGIWPAPPSQSAHEFCVFRQMGALGHKKAQRESLQMSHCQPCPAIRKIMALTGRVLGWASLKKEQPCLLMGYLWLMSIHLIGSTSIPATHSLLVTCSQSSIGPVSFTHMHSPFVHLRGYILLLEHRRTLYHGLQGPAE